MKCIDEDLLQKYIDAEVEVGEKAEVENHISLCSKCAAKLEDIRRRSFFLIEAVNLLSDDTIEIPEFAPAKRLKKRSVWKRYTIGAAAACVLISIFLMVPKEDEKKEEYVFVFELEGEFDANRTFSQQEITIIAIDEQGNIVEL